MDIQSNNRNGRELSSASDGLRHRLLEAHDDNMPGERAQYFPVSSPRQPQILGAICLGSVLLLALTGGSANIFSLYGSRLIRDLGFTQYHVSTISTVLMSSVYFMIPVLGRLCQLTSPSFLAFLSSVLFGVGYISMERVFSTALGSSSLNVSLAFAVSLCAFSCIGSAASAIIIASMTACATRFERSTLKGLFMSIPIASLGLSGILHSNIAVTFYSQPSLSDVNRNELDIVRLFRFFAIISFVAGILGGLGLRVTTSRAMEDSSEQTDVYESAQAHYGTISASCNEDAVEESSASNTQKHNGIGLARLLSDRVLWCLAAANLLLQGACECYNMNLGSVIQSNAGGLDHARSLEATVAQHITALAAASTIARTSAGFMFDKFPSVNGYVKISGSESYFIGLLRSPVMIFITMGMLSACGYGILASAPANSHTSLLVATLLVAMSYGASSSLAPLTTLIWPSQQFPVAYGIINMTPAAGIGLFNMLYSRGYEEGESFSNSSGGICFGWHCYGRWAEWMAFCSLASVVCVLLGSVALRRRRIVI